MGSGFLKLGRGRGRERKGAVGWQEGGDKSDYTVGGENGQELCDTQVDFFGSMYKHV